MTEGDGRGMLGREAGLRAVGAVQESKFGDGDNLSQYDGDSHEDDDVIRLVVAK